MLIQTNQGPVGSNKSPNLSAGLSSNWRHGVSGETVVSRAHGKGCVRNYRGRTYSIQTQTGQFMTEIIGTTQTIGIWNPLGSGIVVAPVRYYAWQTSGSVESYPISTAYTPNAGCEAATGSAITSITPPNTVAVPGVINAGYPNPAINPSSRSLAFAGSAIITLKANPILLKTSGSRYQSDAAPVAVNRFNYGIRDEYLFGEFLISPGMAVWWGAHGAATSIFWMELAWTEIPI